MNTELRFYVIDFLKSEKDLINLTDEEFIAEAEENGRVYSSKGFCDAFNKEEINSNIDQIRIIEVPLVEKNNELLDTLGTDDLKSALYRRGFFTENLWCEDDVKSKFPNYDKETCQYILNNSLTNEATMGQIWFSIVEFGNMVNNEK